MKTQKSTKTSNQMIQEFRLHEFKTVLVSECENPYKEKITSSAKAYELLKPYYQENMLIKEVSYAIFLNRASMPIGIYKISEGGINGTIIDIRLVTKTAIELLSSGLILSHNHPSGQLEASNHDTSITKTLSKCLELFDIRLFDHLILTSNSYLSLADEGLL